MTDTGGAYDDLVERGETAGRKEGAPPPPDAASEKAASDGAIASDAPPEINDPVEQDDPAPKRRRREDEDAMTEEDWLDVEGFLARLAERDPQMFRRILRR
jgi:hypothetical protein